MCACLILVCGEEFLGLDLEASAAISLKNVSLSRTNFLIMDILKTNISWWIAIYNLTFKTRKIGDQN